MRPMRVIHPVASWPANFLLVFILGRYKCNIVNEWMIWLNMYLINRNYLPLCKSCIIQFIGRFTTCTCVTDTDTVVHVMYHCMSTFRTCSPFLLIHVGPYTKYRTTAYVRGWFRQRSHLEKVDFAFSVESEMQVALSSCRTIELRISPVCKFVKFWFQLSNNSIDIWNQFWKFPKSDT
jgi:hypothetical protein